jgi:hypothetical protein
MSLDDALALAGQILADYESPGARDESGLALVWADQLAQVLRELAAACAWRAERASAWRAERASAWRAERASAWRAERDRLAVMATGSVPVRSGDRGTGRLAGMPGAGAALVPAGRGRWCWQPTTRPPCGRRWPMRAPGTGRTGIARPAWRPGCAPMVPGTSRSPWPMPRCVPG